MRSTAYINGKRHALLKIGVALPMLGGAVLGGLSGYAMSPYDRKSEGALLGAGLGALGAVGGAKLAPYLHSAGSAKNTLARAVMPVIGTGLGTVAGIGASQALIDKKTPDRAEDPYQYYPR